MDWERNWEWGEEWKSNTDMTMTKDGLKWAEERRDNDGDDEYRYDDDRTLPSAPASPVATI